MRLGKILRSICKFCFKIILLGLFVLAALVLITSYPRCRIPRFNYGFINTSGELVIPLRFCFAKDFSEGLAAVQVDGKHGYIDKNGRMVISPRFRTADSFSEGLARAGFVDKDGSLRVGFIDKSGRFVIKPKFSDALGFSEGLAAVALPSGDCGESLYGYIDKTGRQVIKPTFPGAWEFSCGVAIVQSPRDGERYYIDKSGKYITLPPGVNIVRTFTEGLGMVGIDLPDGSRKYGYVDATGRLVVQLKYDCAHPFSEGSGLVGIHRADYWHDWFIDKRGQKVLDPPYPIVMSSFSEGLAIVQVKGLLGYMDKSGRMVVPPYFKHAHDFREGLAAVSLDGERWGYINKRGELVVEPKFDRAREFHEGLACVGVRAD